MRILWVYLLLVGVDGFTLTGVPSRLSSTQLRSVAEPTSPSSSSTGTVAPDMEAYAAGYKTVFEELSFKECKPTVGKLPQDLSGTYFRCGPAMFSAGSIVPPKKSIIQPKTPPVKDGVDAKRMVTHPFEGDGGMLGVTLNGVNNTVVSRFRFIRSEAFTVERKKGKRIYERMDSTRDLGACRGNDLITPFFRYHLQKPKNTGNTRPAYWGKRLLTLWDNALPYKMDDLALSTEGLTMLGGELKLNSPFSGKVVIDPLKDRLLGVVNEQGAQNSELTLQEYNAKFKLVDSVTTKLPGFAIFSDFAATENYWVFVQAPVEVNGMQFMFAKEPAKVLQLQNQASTLHMIARDGSSKQSVSVTIPFDGAQDADLQFVNAFEEDGKVVFDAIRLDDKNLNGKMASWPWASSLKDFTRQTCKRSLVRYTVGASGSISKDVLSDSQCYFATTNPAVATQKHKFVYAAIGSMGAEVAPPQGILRLDTESKETVTWIPEAHEFCGEPTFVRSKDSDKDEDGYVLTALFNGKTEETELLVLAAGSIANGPITRIPLGIGVPHGLHGCFSEDAIYSADEIDRRAKLADKMESRGNMWNEVRSDFSGLGLRLDDLEEYGFDF
uniref:Carotenoid oxygenase n=2 Tax=Grammatophora oceanica TaxID=210454 RepID=A0A7S1VX12_9STRA|mmetsp:Transcript_8645/g.12636  ORF Transcript_8645/g.12636 Transcript_8645/m.12636 type:complete len:610 (+) Transcript_8645:49-1878(+)